MCIFMNFLDVNDRDEEGATPLHYAARYKRMKLKPKTEVLLQVYFLFLKFLFYKSLFLPCILLFPKYLKISAVQICVYNT